MVARFPVASAPVAGSGVRISLNPLTPSAAQSSFERNPFQPLVPDPVFDLSEPLHEYLQEQASILRETFERQLDGIVYRPAADLTALFDTEVFPLGTQAEFYSDDEGRSVAIFCQFSQLDSNYGGAPVGTLTGSGKYVVTNRLSLSTNTNVIGLMPQAAVPSEGQYGWVLVEGVNLLPLRVITSDANVAGAELGWGATGFVTSNVVGAVIATQITDETRGSSSPYQAGEVDIQKSSSIGTALVGLANTRIDELTVSLASTNATVTNLETVLVTADEALAQSITTLTATVADVDASVTRESTARVSQGTALAQDILDLRAELSDLIASQITEVNTAFASGDQVLAERITTLDARLTTEGENQAQSIAAFEESIRVLSERSQSSVSSLAELTATIIDPGTGVAANAAAISALDVRVTANEGTISSQASSITTLQTDVTAVQGTASANATNITNLTSTVNTNTGDISTNASSISTLSATVTSQGTTLSGHTSDISSIQGDINGINATRTIEVNANGVVTGIQLISGSGGTSAIEFQASTFRMTDSSGNGVVPFEIVGGIVYIDTARIRDLTVGTGKLADNAITEAAFASTGTDTTISSGSGTVALGSVTPNPVPTGVIVTFTIQTVATSGTCTFEVGAIDNAGNTAAIAYTQTATTDPNTHAYSFRFDQANTVGPYEYTITHVSGSSVTRQASSSLAVEYKK